jgi:hypothetical protein
MEVKFADSFADSLKTLIRHQTWWYKTYSFFRYDTPRFLKNVWRFRKPLWGHYWWDHHALLEFMEIGLSEMSDKIEKYGNEVDESRLKKVKAMKRAAELIHNYNKDLYIDMAEKELGEIIHHPWEFEDVPDQPGYSQLKDLVTPEEKDHNRKVFARAREIEEAEWKELWQIIKGQNYEEFKKLEESLTEDQKKEKDHYNEWFDGSNLKTWWD